MVTAEAPRINYGTYGSLQESGFSWRPEEQKSFDPLASVNMMRYDQERFGLVLPETLERISDEELSLLVEGVDRASRTEFPLKRIGDDLGYYKNGEWKSYTKMLLMGREVAKREALLDPKRQFLADAAVRDLSFGYKMRALKPGQQLVWSAPYPYDIEAKYGEDFMRQCGRFPDRKMGFFYRAYCTDGDVILESQTIDRSDDAAIATALDYAAQNKTADMDSLLRVYDGVLSQKHGGNFYAGRRNAEWQENAWETILAQKDLIHYFLSGLEAIAARPISGWQLEEVTKRHMYGVWAAFKKRIDTGAGPIAFWSNPDGSMPVARYAMLEQEVWQAFRQFAAEGVLMVGCGGAITMLQGEGNILNAGAGIVFNAIFGNSISKDCEYISKECPMCGAENVRTVDKGIGGNRRKISGSCGCSKEYSDTKATPQSSLALAA